LWAELTPEDTLSTTKPGSRPPGICLLSRGVVPGERAQGGLAQLCVSSRGESRDRFQIRVYLVVGGAAGAGTWGQASIGTFRWVRGT